MFDKRVQPRGDMGLMVFFAVFGAIIRSAARPPAALPYCPALSIGPYLSCLRQFMGKRP